MESQEKEYKEKWRDEHLKTICAFANTNGGTLIIGINDKGVTVGVKNSKKLLEDLPSKTTNSLGIISSVTLEIVDAKEIITIAIKAYNVPISYNGKYYKRTGSTTVELNNNELSQFLLAKSGKTWDILPFPNTNLYDVKTETINRFKALAQQRLPSITNTEEVNVILENLRLLNNNYITNAGLLLFSDIPQKHFPSATIKIGEFRDDEDLVRDDIIEGNLLEQVYKAIDILSNKYLSTEYYYDGVERKERKQYPEKALRESLLNAIVHKDYSISSDILIKVYPSKLLISNPGQLPPQLSIDSLKLEHSSIPYNPLIAKTFYYAGLIENWGRGTIAMIKDCREAKKPIPIFENNQGVFKVTFYTTSGFINQFDLNDRQRFILEYLFANENSTAGNIFIASRENGIKTSERTVQRDLEQLVEWGIIIREGETNKTEYSLAFV